MLFYRFQNSVFFFLFLFNVDLKCSADVEYGVSVARKLYDYSKKVVEKLS